MPVDVSTGRHIPANSMLFEFDSEVAAIFDNMAVRSIPGYSMAYDAVARLASTNLHPGAAVLDLGCSTGKAMRSIREVCNLAEDVQFVGVDRSPDMIARASRACPWASIRHQDLNHWPKSKWDLTDCIADGHIRIIVLGWTLQFLDPHRREELIAICHEALGEGGMLFVLEKWSLDHDELNWIAAEQYNQFRLDNGYSQHEIDSKSRALRACMWPDSEQTCRERLERAGFEKIGLIYKLMNFGGYVAYKAERHE